MAKKIKIYSIVYVASENVHIKGKVIDEVVIRAASWNHAVSVAAKYVRQTHGKYTKIAVYDTTNQSGDELYWYAPYQVVEYPVA